MPRFLFAGRIAASVGTVGVITQIYSQHLAVNPTTVALTYVLAVLIIAGSWGIAEATSAALASVLCFNFFFLPPAGTLTVADPQNWVALFVFMVTAIVVSQLSGRSRQRNLDAVARQYDLERLYALSRALLLAEGGVTATAGIARLIADTFQLPSAGLYDHQTGAISWAGPVEVSGLDDRLREVARRGVSLPDGSGVMITAIRLGGAPIGSLAVAGHRLNDTVLQSITNLAAIGLERARGQAATARAEAARASSELRAAVLDAAAHEFKTPLTSMKVAATALRSGIPETDPRRELVDIVTEDLDRLQALVTDAVQMLRIDSGDFIVHRDRYEVAEIIAASLRELEPRLNGHTVTTHVPEHLLVDADRPLLRLALGQLLDNAVKYSPSGSAIGVRADGNGTVTIAVRNSGPTIPEQEQRLIFERFYRGDQARRLPGTGMGLAIVRQIAQAHGGALTVSSTASSETEFTLSLPSGTSTP
jgi:two-component system, OmpR family, sensor histidine kinase KdpD